MPNLFSMKIGKREKSVFNYTQYMHTIMYNYYNSKNAFYRNVMNRNTMK